MSISNVSALSTLINAAMNEATTSGNRSAALIVEMHNNEATFSRTIIKNANIKVGAERTDAIDTIIGLVSDDFKALVARYEVITHKDHKSKLSTDAAKTANAFETGAVLGKIKAARIMVTRAMAAVFYLRERSCTGVSIKKFGSSSSLVAKITDEDGDNVKVTKSVAEMIRDGDKLLAEATGKGKKETGRGATAKNPMGAALADSSKALAAVLTGANSKGVKPITDYSNDVEAQLETTFKELLRMKFFDGDKFDLSAFDAYMVEQFKFSLVKPTKSAEKKAA